MPDSQKRGAFARGSFAALGSTVRLRYILAIFPAVLIAYGAVALSDYPRKLGRTSPEHAAWFRPPLFNFSEHYEAGEALGFRVGERAIDVERKLTTSRARQFELNGNCGTGALYTTGTTFVRPSQVERIRELLARDVVCMQALDTGALVELQMSNGVVERIDVVYVNFEAI